MVYILSMIFLFILFLREQQRIECTAETRHTFQGQFQSFISIFTINTLCSEKKEKERRKKRIPYCDISYISIYFAVTLGNEASLYRRSFLFCLFFTRGNGTTSTPTCCDGFAGHTHKHSHTHLRHTSHTQSHSHTNTLT